MRGMEKWKNRKDMGGLESYGGEVCSGHEEVSVRERLGLTRMRIVRHLAKKQKAFLEDESGLGTIEVVLIIVVLIALVIIFRDRIKALLESIMAQINSSATSVWS